MKRRFDHLVGSCELHRRIEFSLILPNGEKFPRDYGYAPSSHPKKAALLIGPLAPGVVAFVRKPASKATTEPVDHDRLSSASRPRFLSAPDQ
jgi:hypothetical protein